MNKFSYVVEQPHSFRYLIKTNNIYLAKKEFFYTYSNRMLKLLIYFIVRRYTQNITTSCKLLGNNSNNLFTLSLQLLVYIIYNYSVRTLIIYRLVS